MPYKNPHGNFCFHAVSRLKSKEKGSLLVVYINERGERRSRTYMQPTETVEQILRGRFGSVVGVYDQSVEPLAIAEDLEFELTGK